MRRVSCVLAVLGALGSGCGSSASLEFAKGGTTYADASDDTPYPDSATASDTAVADEAVDAGEVLKCPPGKDGKSNVCVRVQRASEGPSISADTKTTFGLDGKGALMVGLAAVKPGSKDSSFIASTWLPTESSGAGKFAATELPKVVEIPVEPGTYWAFAAFRDQEPYNRTGLAVGDYVPRLVELSQVTVVADMGASIDVRLHPVRAVDLDLQLTTTPSGSGTGPLGAWLLSLDDKKIVGEGHVVCADLRDTKTATIRVFTTYTGSFDVGAALFDFSLPTDDGSGLMPAFPAGTIHSEFPVEAVKIGEGDWLAPSRRLDLSAVAPMTTPKPADLSPGGCATYASAPAK